MRLVAKLKQEIKETVESSQLEALMGKIRQQLTAGELTIQEYYFLVFIQQKHFQANLSALSDLLPDLADSSDSIKSVKVDDCELVIEEFEAIEKVFTTMSEIIKT